MPTDQRDLGPSLVMWDVDHTLVSVGGGVSRSIYERAFRQVTGKPLGELAEMSGRTDQAIMVETLRLNGVEEPEALFDDFYAALAAAAEQLTDRMRDVGTVLPGSREAIASCAAHGTVQTAVTGNIRPIAMTKLTALRLGDGLDFSVGGYGDDGSDRAELVRQARKRASQKYGHDFAGTRAVVIGDTPASRSLGATRDGKHSVTCRRTAVGRQEFGLRAGLGEGGENAQGPSLWTALGKVPDGMEWAILGSNQ
ncbi:haloacid dehalogenase-like hydrolase [Actinacidiphila guanduensis]|uniref:haloacid dehalogenase-like hydrolase n=1 Tax=Actinacidiphila guanduensis TaxID=310781 RepID=UPI000B81AB32|nr:haloacid dehalogenase-like hydrolase [Actinacidiphila guanduensis]